MSIHRPIVSMSVLRVVGSGWGEVAGVDQEAEQLRPRLLDRGVEMLKVLRSGGWEVEVAQLERMKIMLRRRRR